MRKIFASACAAVMAAAVVVGAAHPASAVSEEQELVEKARFTADRMLKDPDFGTMTDLMKRAKGVMIIPSLLKAAFFFGAEGGSGVLLARRPGGGWSYPAFYTLGGASFGFQFGGEASEVILLIMNDDAMKAVMKDQIKLGADASVAVGPIGAGIEGATTTAIGADIYSFARAKGLYAGVSLEGTVVYGRESYNEAYYGSGATARAILVEGALANAGADGLRAALAPY
ncbi:MAG: lipid-binding SYLF domain-containing protein [Alphaproteobacteria bacterium]